LLNIAGTVALPQDEARDIVKELSENLDDDYLRKEFFDVMVQLYVGLVHAMN
jgi:nuclear cap-binding protein subunit 1